MDKKKKVLFLVVMAFMALAILIWGQNSFARNFAGLSVGAATVGLAQHAWPRKNSRH